MALALPAASGAAVQFPAPALYGTPDPVVAGVAATDTPSLSAAAHEAPAAAAVDTPSVAAIPAVSDRHAVCMAKVIVHEAGNQPYRGQMAVAQVIRNRIRDGRFGRDACSVVAQRGQFFNVAAYEPSRTSGRWQRAVEIANTTLAGAGEEVVPGALFFHSGGSKFPGRKFIASVADHHFYR